jgi:glucose-1-phosphate thymidylyltransferase
MKGLILSGGFGTRLRPLTYSQQKQLIPVANKPILFYVIEDLIDAGISDIGIVVGPNKNQVIDTINGNTWKAKITFIDQEQPLGIAHAIKISQSFLGKDPFVLYLGDNILREGIVEHVEQFKSSDCEGSILLTEVENPQEFGIATLNEKNHIIHVVEKPQNPESNLAVIGVYMFRSKIFEAVNQLQFSARGQLEITDAIQWLINNGYTVVSCFVKHWWKDTGKPEDILHANRLILDDIKSENHGQVVSSDIRGRVQIGKATVIDKHSMIKGPVKIGDNCTIKSSYIGPYTSVGNNCTIEDSEIEDSVIMDGSVIMKGGRIVDSLIGRGVKIKKGDQLPSAKRFTIGDNSEVFL